MARLKLAAGLVLSAALLGYMLWSVDPGQLLDQLRHTHWGWMGLAFALAPVGLWVRARRWGYLFPPYRTPPALTAAVMIGYMANNVLPLRAGEVVRVYVVSRRWGQGFWMVLGTLVVERVLDSLTIVFILALLVLLVPVPPLFQWAAVTVLAVDLVAAGVLAAFAGAPATCRRWLGKLTARWPALEHRLARVFETFVAGLGGIRHGRNLPLLLVWTLLVWLAPALSAWATMRALALELPFLASWTVLAFVGLGISIPAAPGYIGVFHYAAVLALAIFGVDRPAAVGYALLFHAAHYVPITVTGWLFLLREQMSLADAARARAVEAIRSP